MEEEIYTMYKEELDANLGKDLDEVEIRIAARALADLEEENNKDEVLWEQIIMGLQGEYSLLGMATVFRAVKNYREENKDK